MATTLTTHPESVADDQCVVMAGVDWKGYSTMLRLRGERTQLAFYGEWQRWLMQPKPWERA